MRDNTKILCTALFALVIWFALILQFSLSIQKNVAMGVSFVNAFVLVMSYYTIQTNLLIAVAMTSMLKSASRWGRFFSRGAVLTAMAVYILIVGLIYNIILKGRVKLEGLFILADFLLHTVSPLAYVTYWLVFVHRKPIQWQQLVPWAYFPLSYLAYALARGAVTGRYPYFFINVAQYGYAQVFINSFFVLLMFLALGAILIGLNNFLSKKQTQPQANLL